MPRFVITIDLGDEDLDGHDPGDVVVALEARLDEVYPRNDFLAIPPGCINVEVED